MNATCEACGFEQPWNTYWNGYPPRYCENCIQAGAEEREACSVCGERFEIDNGVLYCHDRKKWFCIEDFQGEDA